MQRVAFVMRVQEGSAKCILSYPKGSFICYMRNVYYFESSESWRRLPNLRLCVTARKEKKSKTISYLDRKKGRIFNCTVRPVS